MKFNISGEPYPFATRGEIPWKENLMKQLPSKISSSREKGVLLSFNYNPAFHGHKLDIDNLCEPVFSILVNKKGWFDGKRPNIHWYQATKKYGINSGCIVELVEGDPVPLEYNAGKILFDKIFTGKLPEDAKDESFSSWVKSEAQGKLESKDYGLIKIQFASENVNLGDIATGKIKHLIDCMFPILGGKIGSPEDYKISMLQVEKGSRGISGSGVRLFVAEVE